MSQILDNNWIITIAGGVISSLITYFITKYFSSKQKKKEYLQKLEISNNEILHLIRPLIIEKKIPSQKILSAVRISTARKYGVKQEDLYDEISISNALINEILANSFLSSEQKIHFCDLLASIKKSDNKEETQVIYLREKSSFFSTYSSISLAMTAFSMSILISLLTFKDKSFSQEKYTNLFGIIIISLLATMSLATFLFLLSRTMKKVRSNRNRGEMMETRKTEEKNCI